MLGDNLIHLAYKYYPDYPDLDIESHAKLYLEEFGRTPWRHKVCEDDGPEDRPQREVVLDSIFGDIEETPMVWPHQGCSLDDDEDEVFSPDELQYWHDIMHLTILRTSRQIYAEANPILYSTNTFSFEDGMSLKRFLTTRNIHQNV